MIQKTMKQNQKGLTLIEVLIGLAIFAVIVSVVLAFFGGVQRSANINAEASNISAIYNKLTQFYNKGRTAGLDNQLAIEGGFIPQSMTIEGSDILNSFNGYVFIEGSGGASGMSDIRAFSIEYTRVPVNACSDFIQTQVRTGWDAVGVEANTSANTPTNHTADTFFRSDNGLGGSRGSTELFDNQIITLCNTPSTEYVNIIFAKDSDL